MARPLKSGRVTRGHGVASHLGTGPDRKSWPPYATPPSAPRTAGTTNIAAANRYHARDPNRPLALLGIT
jgi:hypothetical protein